MPRNRRDDDNDDDSGEHDRPAKPRRRDDDDSGEHDRPAKSRRRDDDESGEHEKPKKKGGLPGWALALIIVGAVLLVCGGTVGAAIYAMYSLAQSAVAAASGVQQQVDAMPTAKKKKYTREEFRTMLIGKTKAEVLELVGKPYRTEEPGSGNYWTYADITYDPINGKTDSLAWVRFNAFDKVAKVDY